MTSIDAKVLEKAMLYDDFLTAMRRYSPTYEILLLNLPEKTPKELAPFISRVRSDTELVMRLDVPVSGLRAPFIAQHFDELEKYFTENPEEFAEGGYSAIKVLDHLAYFANDINRLNGTVSWIAESEYGSVCERVGRLLPFFKEHYAQLRDKATRAIRKAHPGAEAEPSPPLDVSLLPVFNVELNTQGTLYLLKGTVPEYNVYRVLLDLGHQRQLEFCDLPGEDEMPGLELDKGYMIDTLTEEGLLPIPKQRLESAFESIGAGTEKPS